MTVTVTVTMTVCACMCGEQVSCVGIIYIMYATPVSVCNDMEYELDDEKEKSIDITIGERELIRRYRGYKKKY